VCLGAKRLEVLGSGLEAGGDHVAAPPRLHGEGIEQFAF
jgi:hypothetical protein